jgi:enamine deaminase RidA (YjgF/YER057c/UK114 family)
VECNVYLALVVILAFWKENRLLVRQQRWALAYLCLALGNRLSAVEIECHGPAGGASRCVVVGPARLAHTAQVMGVSTSGEGGRLNDQIRLALANTDAALKMGGSSLASSVKLNVYVAQDDVTPEVESALAAMFSESHKPAVSFVTTALPWPTALVAFDAVGIAEQAAGNASAADSPGGRAGQACAVLPMGPRVYISGQAEMGDGTLADATRQTLASLGRTLEFLELSKQHVVQVKCFLAPMTRCADAEQEIARFFQDAQVPPCVFVEWQSSLPIEIEMIVAAADNSALAKGPSVEVRTPPGMSTPAIYSRLTIARHPTTIYTSGLYPADASASPETQLRSLFTHLKQSLDAAGSDWMHLVKATYYVSDDELSKSHNTVRPDYFSPRRPPAASKAKVSGVGRAGHGITMDFIVVPGEP